MQPLINLIVTNAIMITSQKFAAPTITMKIIMVKIQLQCFLWLLCYGYCVSSVATMLINELSVQLFDDEGNFIQITGVKITVNHNF